MIKKTLLRATLLCLITATLSSRAADIIVNQMLTGVHNWTRDNTYFLNGAVFIRSNAVLNIEAGTIIKGKNLGTFGTNVAALYVTRGAKIFAEGTAQNPIIFTSDTDDTTIPDDVDIYQRGLWGGVVIFGRTSINGALNVAGNAATPKYEVYEGLEDLIFDGEAVFRYGGADDADNSGVMRYVSIRHGGAKLSADKEINGLSLGAVGSGTTIEFVEAYAIADDGFEFFGGTVNTKHLVSAFCDDDSFDTDMGYRGKNQFWFGIQAPDARNYAMELNNQINEIDAQGQKLLPGSNFEVYNATLIGAGTASTITTGGRNAAFILRPYLGVTIANSIVTDFNERAIELDTRNGIFAGNVVTNTGHFRNNLWWGFVTGSGSGNVDNSIANLSRNAISSNYWTIADLTNQIANPMLTSISRTNVGATLDPRPATGSPALSDAATTPNNGFYDSVTYRGAFGPNDLWIANWTALSEYGILTPAAQQTVIVNQMLTGVNNWYRTNIYQLNGAVFVRSNAVLNIESGTIVKGKNLGTFGTNVAAIYVTRGAKIFAEGTAQNPIIFTSDTDDTTISDDLDIYQRGLWGGVVIFGRTSINGALNVAGNAATPKYEVYEGLEDLVFDGEAVFRYGGADDNDNSGVMRYVSIRHGGAKLSADKEINGLSLGAVGSGTTIEFIEAYAIADDGFEFFGGTVNTRYLVSAFCDDDSFDTDMGYRGKNQFWFGIQAPDARNYAMELNNQINEIDAQGQKLLPASNFDVYNATLIGAGTSSTITTGGRNAAFVLRPYLGLTFANSVITDFNERAVELDTRNGVFAGNVVTNTTHFKNNLWWGFVTGSGSANVDNSIANLSRNAISSNYWTIATLTNEITNPLLNNITRTNVGASLDPRPSATSPALEDSAEVPAGYVQANYRGAFGPGNSNWAANWTALSEYSVLTGAGAGVLTGDVSDTPVAPTLAVSTAGGNLDVTFSTQPGVTYQVQSTTTLSGPITWVNEGGAVAGSGTPATVTISAAANQKFIVVRAE